MTNSTSQCTVKDLLPDRLENMEAAVAEQVENDPELAKQKLPGFARRIISARATRMVLDALNDNILLLLPEGWSKAGELAQFAIGNQPPDTEKTLFLGEHDFDIDYKPVVSIKFGEIERPLLKFKVILRPHIKSAAITVKNGHIVSIGKCEGTIEAELRFLGGADEMTETLFSRKMKSRAIELLEPFELKSPGVPISIRQPSR